MKKDEYCIEVYQAIHECPDMPTVITTVALMGYRIVGGMKPHSHKYGLGHISIAHPDHDSKDNPLWISGYIVLNKRSSWVVR